MYLPVTQWKVEILLNWMKMKIKYQNLLDVIKAIFKGKFIALNAYIRKVERLKMN